MKDTLLRWGKLLGISLGLATVLAVIIPQMAFANTPNSYWVGGTGNWTDAANHWASTSNGVPDISNLPAANVSVHMDANSFTGVGQVLTVDATASCLNMDWTGATNSPTLAGTGVLINPVGNVTFIAAMVSTGTITLRLGGTGNVTTNGASLNLGIDCRGAYTYADNINLNSSQFTLTTGTLTLATGVTLTTTGQFTTGGASAKTLTANNAVINCGAFIATAGGGALTVTANTAIINVSGTGVGTFGNVNYNGATFNLNGSSHTVSGNFTNATINLNPAVTQTITFTAGEDIQANALSLNGTSGHQHTLTAAAGYTLNTSGVINTNYVTIHYCTATNNGVGYGGSVDNGNNVNWFFPLTVTTRPVESLTYDKNGLTVVTLNGTPITDMGGNATANTWTQWGTSSGNYTFYTTNTTYSTTNFTGNNLRIITATMVPGNTYYYRRAITAGTNTTYGAEGNWTLVLPTISTTTPFPLTSTSVGLRAIISDMGNATSTYLFFQYGPTSGYGTSTANVTETTIGTKTISITPSPGDPLHYRAVIDNAGVSVNGLDESVSAIPSALDNLTGFKVIMRLTPLILWVLAIIGSIITMFYGVKTRTSTGGMMMIAVGLVMLSVTITLLPIILMSISVIERLP